MTEERTSEPTQPIGDQPPVGGETRTVEQVEAEYRSRQAGKDREAAALRDELARYKAAEDRQKAEAEARRTAELGEVEALKRQLAEEQSGRLMDARKARFPHAADVLDTSALAAMDEAKLAALEERLTPRGSAPPQRVDPNSPPRTPAQGVPQPKSEAELRADLERLAPEFIESLNA